MSVARTGLLAAVGNTPLVRLRRVVTFACDSGMKYLGGHLYAQPDDPQA